MNGGLINEKPEENNYVSNSKRSKDMVVSLLDDTEYSFDVAPRSKGEELLKKVNSHLNLDESEFFGLLFDGQDKIQYWLDPQKPIIKQIKDPINTKFKFRVMYYTPDPNSLLEYTRYLFTLQIRRDLLDGRLLCSEDTGALLASYIVQGELGNYNPAEHKPGYLKGFNFVPNQTPEIEDKIVDYHISHRGKNPAESDHQMLNIARKLDMYGITLYPAEDCDGNDVDLTVHHMGICLFKKKEKTTNFAWVDLRKLSFKKKKVLLKLRAQGSTLNIISFTMKNRNAAKNFWKICVNHHVFFRAQTAIKKKSSFKKGSTYHYSGRTKKEIAQVAQRVRRPNENEPDPNHLQPYNENTTLSSSVSNASSGSKYRSDDDASYSFQSDTSSQNKEYDKVSEHAAGNNIQSSYHYEGKESEAVENEDVISEEVYPSVDSDNLFSEKAFPKIGLLDKLKMSNGEDDSLDVNIPITNPQLEDETDLGLDTFKTQDFSLEVESMFQKINSEYGGSPTGWQYNLTSITPSEHEDDAKDEGSETEDNLHNPSSEFTEVDANQVLVDLTHNEFKNSDKTEADNQSEICNESETVDSQILCDEAEADHKKKYSDKTEADEETEMQLKQRVRAKFHMAGSSLV